MSLSPSLLWTYNIGGHFHDQLMDDIAQDLEKLGSKVVKNVKILGINGLVAIPDLVSLPVGQPFPYFVEIKTGFAPDLTSNKRHVYSLICQGWHAIAMDPRLEKVGLKVGQLLPPLDVQLIYTPYPGAKTYQTSLCALFGIWR